VGRMKIAILGGGLMGLTLAYLMKQNGLDFDVLEKGEECGGLMKSLRTKEFTFDYGGSHIIFSKNKRVLRFMLGLLGKNKIRRRRNTKILYKGRYVKYPFENGLADLPREENYECLCHFIQNLIRRERGEIEKPNNLREWCFYTFGKGIAEKYLIPYNEKIEVSFSENRLGMGKKDPKPPGRGHPQVILRDNDRRLYPSTSLLLSTKWRYTITDKVFRTENRTTHHHKI